MRHDCNCFSYHTAFHATQYALSRNGVFEGLFTYEKHYFCASRFGHRSDFGFVFSTRLKDLFTYIEAKQEKYTENIQRIIALQDTYIATIEPVISFLQGKNPTLAQLICQDDFLPEAARFAALEDLDWAFGSMGYQDKAKHLATLYLEDISDLIIACVDSHFGFSRYAERLGRSANSFDELYLALQQDYSYIDHLLIRVLQAKMEAVQPKLVAISVPFPGNLYAALRCGQWIKKHFPDVKIAMGGGFPNTELRSLSDERVFEFWDFVCLDDGEAPIENILQYIEGQRDIQDLKRTFCLIDGKVNYINNSTCKDYNSRKWVRQIIAICT